MAAAPSSARAATAVDVRDASRPTAGRRRFSAPRSVVLVVLLAAGVAWIVLLWGLSNHVFPGNSDDANALLAGRSIVHGNVLLAGWRLPSDPMVAIDIPLYGVFTLLIGVRPAVLHAVPVTLAVVAVGVACWVASLRVTNRLLAAAVAFILVGLPARPFATWLLQSPMHVSTTILCLVAFALLRWSGRTRRWWMGTAVLGVALFADPFAFVIGVGPILAAGATGSIVERRWGRLVSAVAASAIAVVASLVVRALVSAVGFSLAKSVALRKPDSLWSHYQLGARRFFQLLGATPGTPRVSQNPVLHWVHFIGAAAIVLAGVIVVAHFSRAAWRGPRTDSSDPSAAWLDHTLLFGVLASIGGFALLYNGDPSSRYTMAGVVYAAALTGRVAGRWAPETRTLRGAVAAVLLVLGVIYALTPVTNVRHSIVGDDAHRTVAWLDARGLHEGVAPYWFASYFTVLSRDHVHVRPVVGHGGRLAGSSYFADSDWFTDQPGAKRFVVIPAGEPDGVNIATATATFGPPSSVTAIGGYQVAVWDDGGRGQLSRPVDERVAGLQP